MGLPCLVKGSAFTYVTGYLMSRQLQTKGVDFLHIPISKHPVLRGMFLILVLARKLFMNPHKLLMFVHHADKTAKARVFFFEEGVQFTEQGAFGSLHGTVRQVGGVGSIIPVGEFA